MTSQVDPQEEDAMTSDEVLHEAGAWYSQVLGAVENALAELGFPKEAGPAFLAALAREGYLIDAPASWTFAEKPRA